MIYSTIIKYRLSVLQLNLMFLVLKYVQNFMLIYKTLVDTPMHAYARCIALSPGHSQILSRSRGEKSGEGLGSKLRHGLEMVDSASSNRVHITY